MAQVINNFLDYFFKTHFFTIFYYYKNDPSVGAKLTDMALGIDIGLLIQWCFIVFVSLDIAFIGLWLFHLLFERIKK